MEDIKWLLNLIYYQEIHLNKSENNIFQTIFFKIFIKVGRKIFFSNKFLLFEMKAKLVFCEMFFFSFT